jgi:histidine triad (HIT) family protein
MAELVDARDSKSRGGNIMSVRLRLPAPFLPKEFAMAGECIFCKIIRGEIPSEKIAENDTVLVIRDIVPKAPVHYLILPKKHIVDLRALSNAEKNDISALLFMAQELSSKLGGVAFRLLVNNGAEIGQSVPHLHIHFLAGRQMHDF